MSSLENVLYPKEYKSGYIKEHPKYKGELKDLIERSGFKDKFWNLYKNKLRWLEKERENCIERDNWFELLKYADGNIYSMIFKTQKNIRILFGFVDLMGNQHAVLLHPFEEKDRKKSGKCYRTAIPIAQARLWEVYKND